MKVADARRALALAAARFYARQPATIAAVTGTSGKTSVVAFTRQIWARLGSAAASIGTIGVVTPTRELYGSLTTPDPVALHRTLDELAGDGVTHLALEASSHGLDQRRLDGVRVAAGGFTNITRDHLDYHPTVEAYVKAKLHLFEALIAPGWNRRCRRRSRGCAMPSLPQRKHAVCGCSRSGARAMASAWSRPPSMGSRSHCGSNTPAGALRLRLPLVGAFQVDNALVAAGLAIATGSDPAGTFAALEHLVGAKGRFELIGERAGAPVFVDYAHKPDALRKALAALRPYVSGRLVVVFGAGGDRDPGKRPMMGAIAAEMADQVIVTDDNPRSEDPSAIRAAIMAAAPGATEIGDRREAIRTAIAALERGDALLVAGKGHESGQIIGDRTLPFSDHETVAAALKEVA